MIALEEIINIAFLRLLSSNCIIDRKKIILTLANFITFLLLSTKITLKNLRAHVTLYSLANQLWHRNELGVSSFSFWSLVLPAFHCKQQAYPPWTDIADPERGRPLARHHPSSVGLYKYTIVLILYLFHPLRSFCSQGSSFYILAASAKQLMCTECVDSNCLAIVAPSRLALYTLAPVRTRGGGWWRIVVPCAEPAGLFRSILPTFCDKSTLPRPQRTWNFATLIYWESK